jgi:hypothetical protein
LDERRTRGIFISVASVWEGVEEGGCEGQDEDGGADEDACAKVFSEVAEGVGGGEWTEGVEYYE